MPERPLSDLRTVDLEPLEYSHDGVTMRGRLALPAGPGPHPAVLVMHDARGLGDGPAQRAQSLADAGYVALAADMFGDGAFFAEPREAGPSVGRLMQDSALLLARAQAALAALRSVPGVDPDRIAAIGFCFGGACVLEIARSGADVRAVVSLHGLLRTRTPAQPGTVRAKALVLTGAKDPYVPIADVEAFRAEMGAAGVDHHVTIYSEGYHAFAEDEEGTMAHMPGIRHDPLLDRLAWAQTTAFVGALTQG